MGIITTNLRDLMKNLDTPTKVFKNIIYLFTLIFPFIIGAIMIQYTTVRIQLAQLELQFKNSNNQFGADTSLKQKLIDKSYNLGMTLFGLTFFLFVTILTTLALSYAAGKRTTIELFKDLAIENPKETFLFLLFLMWYILSVLKFTTLNIDVFVTNQKLKIGLETFYYVYPWMIGFYIFYKKKDQVYSRMFLSYFSFVMTLIYYIEYKISLLNIANAQNTKATSTNTQAIKDTQDAIIAAQIKQKNINFALTGIMAVVSGGTFFSFIYTTATNGLKTKQKTDLIKM